MYPYTSGQVYRLAQAVLRNRGSVWAHPNDKQDVYLALSCTILLKEIWGPPTSPSQTNPAFARAHQALHTYGHFVRNLVMPYICVDYTLTDQHILLCFFIPITERVQPSC